MSAKSLFYSTTSTFLKSVSLNFLSKYLPYRDLVIVYHSVSDQQLKHAKHLFPYRSSKAFIKDLDDLSKTFDFIDWETFLQRKQSKNKTGKPKLLLTFDDGYRDFHDVIAPILKQKGIFAINFINPKFIDNHEMMWRNKASLIISELEENKDLFTKIQDFKTLKLSSDFLNLKKEILSITFQNQHLLDDITDFLTIDVQNYLKEHQVYLTTPQLESLQKDGFGIAAHGWDHPLYHQLTENQQLENTQKALDFLSEKQLNNDAFAFPFTDFGVSKSFFENLFNINPQLQFTFGAAGLKFDSRFKNLQRIPMEAGNYSASQILKSEILYFQFLKLVNKHRI